MGYNEESALSSILNELMQAVFSNNYEKVECLSKAYQRIKATYVNQ